MKIFYKKLVSVLAVAFLATITVALPLQAAGVDVLDAACQGGGASQVCNSGGDLAGIWNNITDALTVIVGAVAVIMIIIGGIKYATANGDQSAITSAKNTVMYSLVGLILAIMAGGIIKFVLGYF